jgi:prephenate dehydratase
MLDTILRPQVPNQQTRDLAVCLADVRLIRTLGPQGTNCERAAHYWFRNRTIDGEVALHQTLEDGVKHLKDRDRSALLACAVYPDLHTLVFSNLHWLALADSFIIPTHNMLLASRGGQEPRTVASHPAPQGLVPHGTKVILVTSNAQAALDCAEGRVDACITTQPAAEQHGLRVLKDFGPVPMDFTIHVPL